MHNHQAHLESLAFEKEGEGSHQSSHCQSNFIKITTYKLTTPSALEFHQNDARNSHLGSIESLKSPSLVFLSYNAIYMAKRI